MTASVLLWLMVATAIGACGVGPGNASESSAAADSGAGSATLAFVDIRVFDGDAVLESATVLIDGDTIAAVGADVAVPPGTRVIDGAGHTLLPGLIDAHTHTWYEQHLRQALAFGVTTELDMLGDPVFLQQMHMPAADRADLFGAGNGVTVPGGHGTQFGPVPTLGPNDDPAAFVAARLAEGSDFIKLLHEDGSTFGETIPTLRVDQLTAAIAAAQSRGAKAVVHISSRQRAREAIDAGADALVHVWVGGADPALAGALVQHGAFVVPTLSVYYSECDGTRGSRLAADPAIARFVAPDGLQSLGERFPSPNPPPCSEFVDAIGSLRAAGAPILAGTDAPNPGTAHGVSLHDELALLVEAGMSPDEALASATSVVADAMDLPDRGRIAPGLRADLLLVRGDPTADIAATLDIEGVWHLGRELDREAYAGSIGSARSSIQSRSRPRHRGHVH